MPRIESTNLVGDIVAAAIEEVATKSTREAVINVILRNKSQDIFRYKISCFPGNRNTSFLVISGARPI